MRSRISEAKASSTGSSAALPDCLLPMPCDGAMEMSRWVVEASASRISAVDEPSKTTVVRPSAERAADFFRRPGGPDHVPIPFQHVQCQRPTGIAGAEDEEFWRHQTVSCRACCHFVAHVPVTFLIHAAGSELGEVSGVDQTATKPIAAAPRTSGEGSSSRRRQAATRPGSPEFPAAIRTLRMNRSRPIRLTGDPENCSTERGIVEFQEARAI